MASSATPAAVDPQRDESPAAATNTTTTGEQTATAATETPPASGSESVDKQQSQPAAPQPAQPQQSTKPAADDDDDDDSDFDELDEVLDDFKPQPSAPAPSKPDVAPTPPAPAGAGGAEDFDEAAFMKQLEQDMASMMGAAAKESGAPDSKGFAETVDQGADAFTKQLEESGIPPGDFIKQLLADVMAEEGGEGGSSAAAAAAAAVGASSSTAKAAAAAAKTATEGGAPPENFNDAIQRTINRMKESGDKATAAAEEEDDISDDLVAQLLKAVEAGAAGGDGDDDGDLSKMFMGMMEQLSNKEMLYEPMKELHVKFGPWIAENKGKGKVSEEEMSRFERQAEIVAQIVGKFEEKGYTDEDAKCREYVWERMQEMQAAGNPPEELVANPWSDEKDGAGGPGGVPDCPQQ